MSVDLEAIRKKIQQLSGQRRTSSVQLWKPQLGEFKVRLLPWKNAPEGQPFMERWFYYLGEQRGILAPNQFNKPDPINDLIRKLYSSGSPDDRVMAKTLQPKMRAYAPLIVRGEEDKGVQVWSFGKLVYNRLLSFFLDEDYGDILDPKEGFDLKVTITKVPGKQYNDTVVDCKGRPSPALADPEKVKLLLEQVPNLDDMYQQKSEAEVKAALDQWLSMPSDGPAGDDEGSGRGAEKSDDALDKLSEELKSKSPKPMPKIVDAPAKKVAPKVKAEDVDEPKAKSQTLDDAFDELMKDES